MRYWIGLMFFAGGGWLAYAGLAHRARILAARSGRAEAPAAETPMFVMGEIARPIILGLLAFAGLKTSFAYWAFGGGRVLSLFDLGGFLFLLAAYGAWLTLTMRYREAAVVVAPAAPAAVPAVAQGDEGGPARDVVGHADPDRDDPHSRNRARVRGQRARVAAESEAA